MFVYSLTLTTNYLRSLQQNTEEICIKIQKSADDFPRGSLSFTVTETWTCALLAGRWDYRLRPHWQVGESVELISGHFGVGEVSISGEAS